MTNAKRIRLEKKMTHVDVTVRCGLPPSEISRIERRVDVENLSLKTVCKIAKGLNVKLWDVINNAYIISKLHEVMGYDAGIILDGDKSPIAEIREIYGMTQYNVSVKTKITQAQISTWERHGMDNANIKNFINVAHGLGVNIGLLIWDENLLNLYNEVI